MRYEYECERERRIMRRQRQAEQFGWGRPMGYCPPPIEREEDILERLRRFHDKYVAPPPPDQSDTMRDALIDIANDCGTLDAAQRRAREGLK